MSLLARLPRRRDAARVRGLLVLLAVFALAGTAHAQAAPPPSPAATEPASAESVASVASAESAAPAEIVPREWLVIAPLDVEGRRPFRADTVFATHLLDRGSPPPEAGGALTGELGVEQHWEAFTAGEDGALARPDGARIGWAFTTLEVPAGRVMLAHLPGGGTLWVNGDPFPGDPYALGFSPVPVALRAGRNALFVSGIRGSARLRLTTPEHALLLARGDLTLPDLDLGSDDDADEDRPLQLGALVLNASLDAVPSLLLDAGRGTDPRGAFGLPPLGLLKLPVTLLVAGEHIDPAYLPRTSDAPDAPDAQHTDDAPAAPAAETLAMPLRLGGHPGEAARDETFTLPIRTPDGVVRHLYRSAVDDSVQEFAVRWPSSWSRDDRGRAVVPSPQNLLLTLHGAGVMPAGQAASYSAKPDFWIVAPSNRRAFGFDWQDWGRRDAYDVLSRALELPGVDRSRVFLAGHSMGGHGTWSLAANDPDRFLAIAPSAGWASFDTYGGRPDGALSALWHGADGSSNVPGLVENLAQMPAYIVHGTADDNVPASEAHAMEAALIAAGRPPLTHYEEGAGHWWDGPAAPGADCVDWPGIFELFRATPTPDDDGAARDGDPAASDGDGETARDGDVDWHWISVDPGVDGAHHGLVALQPLRYGEPLRLEARWSRALDSCEILTRNVRRFAVRRWPGGHPPATLLLDGERVPDGDWSRTDAPAGWLADDDGAWREAPPPAGALDASPPAWPAGEKRLASSGPFKRAFDRGFVLVHGTAGDAAESAELLARARADATTWWYRGNGCAPLLTDRQFLSPQGRAACAGRNLILYGNADSNAAWSVVVPEACPLKAHRGLLELGAQRFPGPDLGAVCVYPRADAAGAPLVGLFADSGAAGTRLGMTLLPFVSGVGYPDYAVFGPEVVRGADRGVLAAGWFDARWMPESSTGER